MLLRIEPRRVSRYDWAVTPGEPTTIVTGQPGAVAARRLLLVVGEAHVGTHPFPDGATLVLGRDPACEISLVHPKISRRHVAFHGGPSVEVEDLGSTNGVFLGGRRLAAAERAPLPAGEALQVGPYMVFVLGAASESSDEAPVN